MHDRENGLLAAIAFMSTSVETEAGSDRERLTSAVAVRFGLSEHDREALRQVSTGGVARFAAALRTKRVENIAYIFRRTLREISRLDGGLAAVTERFWHACPPRPDEIVNAYMDSAAGFRDLLAAKDYPDALWLTELAATEYAVAELVYNAEPFGDPLPIDAEAFQRSDTSIQASPNVRLLRLRWDILQFLSDGLGHAAPIPLSTTRHVVLRWTIESRVQALAVSPSTFAVLEACFDGPVSVGGLLARWTSPEAVLRSRLRTMHEWDLVAAR